MDQKSRDELMKVYPDGKKVAYVTALTKEILRFWSSILIGLPRANISPAY